MEESRLEALIRSAFEEGARVLEARDVPYELPAVQIAKGLTNKNIKADVESLVRLEQLIAGAVPSSATGPFAGFATAVFAGQAAYKFWDGAACAPYHVFLPAVSACFYAVPKRYRFDEVFFGLLSAGIILTSLGNHNEPALKYALPATLGLAALSAITRYVKGGYSSESRAAVGQAIESAKMHLRELKRASAEQRDGYAQTLTVPPAGGQAKGSGECNGLYLDRRQRRAQFKRQSSDEQPVVDHIPKHGFKKRNEESSVDSVVSDCSDVEEIGEGVPEYDRYVMHLNRKYGVSLETASALAEEYGVKRLKRNMQRLKREYDTREIKRKLAQDPSLLGNGPKKEHASQEGEVADRELELYWRLMRAQKMDPEVVHAVLVVGFGLDGADPRIAERYINYDDFMNRVNRVIPAKMSDAQAYFRSLVAAGVISEKKRGEVVRLDARWHERAGGIEREYISYALERRNRSGRLPRPNSV